VPILIWFLEEAAAELFCEEAAIKQDLGHVLRELEKEQDALIRQTLGDQQPQVPVMTDRECRDAMPSYVSTLPQWQRSEIPNWPTTNFASHAAKCLSVRTSTGAA